ncbi:MAG: porin family protein [Ferruginibacter sp.]
MNKKLLLFAAILFMGSSTFAQKFTLGIKGGANLGKMSGQSFKDEYTLGYQVGGFATIPFGGRLALQPEVMFNHASLDTASNFSEIYQFNKVNNVSFNSLSIPILLNYNLNKYLTVQVGPQFGVVLDQDKNILQNGEEAFKSGNFSLVGGVQLNLLKFRIYGRYVGGLTNLDNVGNNDSWKASAIQVGLGIAL